MPKGSVVEGKGVVLSAADQERARRVAAAVADLVGRTTTQRALAAELGWGAAHLSHVLSYRQPLKVSELLAICSSLGVDPLEILRSALGDAEVVQPPKQSQRDLDAKIELLKREMSEHLDQRIKELSSTGTEAPPPAKRAAKKGRSHA